MTLSILNIPISLSQILITLNEFKFENHLVCKWIFHCNVMSEILEMNEVGLCSIENADCKVKIFLA